MCEVLFPVAFKPYRRWFSNMHILCFLTGTVSILHNQPIIVDTRYILCEHICYDSTASSSDRQPKGDGSVLLGTHEEFKSRNPSCDLWPLYFTIVFFYFLTFYFLYFYICIYLWCFLWCLFISLNLFSCHQWQINNENGIHTSWFGFLLKHFVSCTGFL